MLISGITGIDLTGLPINNSGNTEVEGNLNLSGVGARITGDFSNSTLANRVAFQTSTLNGATSPFFIPNGTGTKGQVVAGASSDSSNSSYISIMADSSTGLTSLNSGASGTGSFLPMIFTTNGSERMRIDSAGNVGIGVTPSAWGSSYKAIGVEYYGNVSSSQTDASINLSSNTYYNGSNWIYKETGVPPTLYKGTSTGYIWRTAPSGTAGNTISWTNAMTLASSGNLLVGTSTDDGLDKLQINGSISYLPRLLGSPTNWIDTIPDGKYNIYGNLSQQLPLSVDYHYTISVITYSNSGITGKSITAIRLDTGDLYIKTKLNTTWSSWLLK